MAGIDGKDIRVFVEVGSVMTEVACQGAATYNTGKTLAFARAKNCKHPFQQDAGATIAFTALVERPEAATHAALLEAADDFADLEVEFKGTSVGDPEYSGTCKVAYEQLEAPEEGSAVYSFTLGFQNDPTRSTLSASDIA